MNLKGMTGLILLGLVTACSDSVQEEKNQNLGRKIVYKEVWAKDSLTPREQMLDTLAGGENPNSPTLPPKNKWDKYEKDIKLSDPMANSYNVRTPIEASLDEPYDDQLL
jgi:hypothetical protein